MPIWIRRRSCDLKVSASANFAHFWIIFNGYFMDNIYISLHWLYSSVLEEIKYIKINYTELGTYLFKMDPWRCDLTLINDNNIFFTRLEVIKSTCAQTELHWTLCRLQPRIVVSYEWKHTLAGQIHVFSSPFLGGGGRSKQCTQSWKSTRISTILRHN